MCVVELVGAIVRKKIFQRLFHHGLVLGIAQGAADQRRCPIADIGGNHIAGKFGPVAMPQHGIDRVNEIEARVDERAIEVKDQQLNRIRGELAMKYDQSGRSTSLSPLGG